MAVGLSFYKSPISEEIREEGRAQARAESIALVLTTRGIDIPDDVRRQIAECRDLDILGVWLTRAITAPSAEAIFKDDSDA